MARTNKELSDLAASFLAWHSGQTPDARYDVNEGLTDEDGWRLLVVMVNQAQESALGAIAAGPCEDWMSDARAHRWQREIEHEIATNPKIRRMLRGAWNLPGSVAVALARTPSDDE